MVAHNLPGQPTPFVGRAKEVSDIARLLVDPSCRLLTLVGPGGMGKTRLAVEVSRQVSFPHGAYFVPLQPLTSPDFIIPAIVEVIGYGFYGSGDPKQQLFDFLQEKALLLVLDNFEQLLAGAPLLTEILAIAPDLRLLVTSRERLNLREEWVYDLQGLAVPKEDAEAGNDSYDAVRLFVEIARRADHSFELITDQAPSVTKICRMVGGMPLGIELASAWVRVLSCEAIVAEMERSLDILKSPVRNIEARHRTIRAAFEPTWNQLSEDERDVFIKLSVFRGGFTREAAQQVAEASLTTLMALVDKSLVRMEARGRYDLHELLRQYGEEHLGQHVETWQNAHDLHCRYYADLLRQRWKDLSGKRTKDVLEEIEAEIDNVRAYWKWAVEYHKQVEMEIALDSLWFFYDTGNRFQEGEQLFAQAITALRNEASPLLLGMLLSRQGSLNGSLDHDADAIRQLQESIDILRTCDAPEELAFALFRMGQAKPPEEEGNYFQESYSLYQKADSKWGMAQTMFWLGALDEYWGRYENAQRLYGESLAIFETMGNVLGIAQVKSQWSQIARISGNFVDAQRLAQDGLTVFQEMGIMWGLPVSYIRLADALIGLNDYKGAGLQLQQGLTAVIKYHLVGHAVILLSRVAMMRIGQNRTEQAVELLNIFITHRSSANLGGASAYDLLDELKWKISSDSFSKAAARGKARDVLATVREVLLELQQETEQDESPMREGVPLPLADPLTERELEVLHLVADGHSNRAIAERLVLSLGTVKWYISEISGKLGADNRTRAVARARELHLLD